MSNITTLLEVADDVAFSNLFDVTIGNSSTPKKAFNLRIENITIDGASLEYTVNESTKQHQLVKAIRSKTINIRVRETHNFYFYYYLHKWFTNFFDPVKNQYAIGNSDDILKRRNIYLHSYGNFQELNSQLVIGCTNAMIQKLPALNLDYGTSKPITYEVSFVVDALSYRMDDAEFNAGTNALPINALHNREGNGIFIPN